MSEMKFTPSQQDAIDVKGGSVIVSAAAGSGKTRVLVQRVIKMLTDKNDPVLADRLLIVTFTNAAADEMRKRIMSAIEEIIKEQPENMFLRRQQILLSNADICTIHSFCSRILRENFFMLDINQDFRIAQDTELAVMKYRIMSDMIEEKYKENTKGFYLLSAMFSGAKSDRKLEQTLLEIYSKSNSHADVNKWLDDSVKLYNPNTDLEDSKFADIAYDILESSIKYFEIMLESADTVISQNDKAFCTGSETCGEKKYDYLSGFVAKLSRLAKERDWNKISEHITSFESKKYISPRSKKNPVSSYDIQTVKISFSNIDNEIKSKLLPIFGITKEIYKSDTERIYPAVCCMCDIIKEFSERFFEKKKEKGILDFSDLEHLTYKLLKDEHSDKKSELAKIISERYDAVMIDEFQDTNEIQDKIFRYVSRNEKNMFVVGDVKQSIYRFREAMPEIFKEKRNRAVMYNRENPEFPSCIILDKNFRSRENIINSVNYVFGTIMSEYVGEIEYNENEKLTTGAVYPQSDFSETEIHVLDALSGDDDDRSEYEKEAFYIADMIKKMISDGVQISENGKMRNVRYGDFCILMRYLKGHSQEYTDIMNNAGVSAYVDQPYSLFECYEVNMILSFLKAVDNRSLDIALLAVMISPVFGFTPDDLAYLKINFKSKHLYSKIYMCSEIDDNNEDRSESYLKNKCKNFIKLMDKFRKLSVTSTISELAENFFEQTGYVSIINAMPNGDVRVKNIRKLMSFIRDYEDGSKGSLSDFVRHISYLEESETDISINDTEPENVVKIMSIHRSKGLEFPICIMAGMNMSGNRIPPEVYCHKELGFGMKMIEPETMFKYNTLQRNIIKQSAEREELSEAMRILYVAMTRAKEKLIAVITVNSKQEDGLSKKLNKIAALVKLNNNRIDEHCVESGETLGNWILMCAMAHPMMSELRKDAGAEDTEIIKTDSVWKYVKGKCIENENTEEISKTEKIEYDEKFFEFLRDRFAEKYKYQSRTEIPSKVSASALAHNDEDSFNIILSKPMFTQEDNMTGAEKGTAMHTFLQYADFGKMIENAGQEKIRLLNSGMISKEEFDCISEDDIIKFTKSKTYEYITTAERAEKEYRFTVNISADEIGEKYSGSKDDVLLQGAMDCLVINSNGMIIIDYKTDKVQYLSDLKRRYKKQLELYKNAAEQIFQKPVLKCLIYSTRLGEEIEV